jgi:hypothetical protein
MTLRNELILLATLMLIAVSAAPYLEGLTL